ncbi:MAG: hypothetical protein J6Q39_03965 [Bacteroidales bacterium]|nr:hypothetical protein [Bacteroidales bacterium]
MATKNKDGLVVRYGLEQAPDITVSSASHLERGYVVEIKGPAKEKSNEVIIPKGTLIGEVVALFPVEPFAIGDNGTVTIRLVDAKEGSLISTLMDAAGVAILNEGMVETTPKMLTEDAKVEVTIAGKFSAQGVARFVISAMQSA